MGLCAGTGKYGYRISRAHGSSYFIVKVPTFTGMIERSFTSELRARNWQITLARRVWGLERWQIIKTGRLAVFRRFGVGVAVRTIKRSQYLKCGGVSHYVMYSVEWYDHQRKRKTKIFSYKRYGENAEIEAHWFAAKQRAALTCSELHLPPELTPYAFDLKNSVRIDTTYENPGNTRD